MVPVSNSYSNTSPKSLPTKRKALPSWRQSRPLAEPRQLGDVLGECLARICFNEAALRHGGFLCETGEQCGKEADGDSGEKMGYSHMGAAKGWGIWNGVKGV